MVPSRVPRGLQKSIHIFLVEASVKQTAKVDRHAVQARCVRLPAKAADAALVAPDRTRRLSRGEDDLLIEVKAAAVNPSDVKAATGLMPYAVFPRTPGRDYAGS